MKRALFAATIAAVAFAAPAHAQRAAIYTGGQSGAYYSVFCPPLPSALEKAYFTGFSCKTSAGSVDNIQKVLADPKQIGFAQFDVFAVEAARNPDVAKRLVVVRQLACEGMWMITKNPAIKTYGDVLKFASRIPYVLPPKGSGSVATFDHLRELDKAGLGRAQNVKYAQNVPTLINEVASGNGFEVGFFVQFADPENANIKAIIEKGLHVVPIASRDVLNSKVQDKEVYQIQSFTLKSGGFFTNAQETVATCTPVVIFTGRPEALPQADQQDQQEMIQKITSMPDQDFLPQESRFASLIKATKRLSGSALEEMMAAADKASKAIGETISNK